MFQKYLKTNEATHILTHRAGEGRLYKLPQWLDEGLAEYGNMQPSYSYDLALEFAIGTNRLITPITLSQKTPKSRDFDVNQGSNEAKKKFLNPVSNDPTVAV